MSRLAFVQMTVTVQVTINDDSVVTRCIENEDGWRDTFYRLETEDDVLEHLAYNCINNGVEDVSRLDGWADLEPGAATARIIDVEPW